MRVAINVNHTWCEYVKEDKGILTGGCNSGWDGRPAPLSEKRKFLLATEK